MAAFQIRQYPQLRRPALAVPVALLLVLFVAYVDWVTGPEFVMGQLYLLPVALVTVLLGGRAGMATAVVTVIIWGIAELLGAVAYSHWAIAMINGVMRLAYLALVVWLLAVWRGAGESLEAQVRERTAALETEIAERRQTEDALHALALKLSDAEEAERRRLAHDIHDSVGQSLTLLKLRLQSAITVPADDPERHVRDGIEILDGAIKQTRTLMFELHPPMLDDLGIVPALRGLAKELGRQASVEIEIVEEGQDRRLPKPLAGYLFRSIKELLSNAVRHGHSTDIVVTLYWWPQRLRVTVDDNGDGFDPSAARRGLGLAGIRERVATLGGSLSIESNPGQGTRAIIDVPVQ